MNDTARPACEQWGLPDWHDESKYPDHKVVSIFTWCWEFLRRSPAYREFWQQKVFPHQQAHQVTAIEDYDEACRFLEALGDRRSPHEVLLDGLGGGGTLYGTRDAQERFGLMQAYDPRQSAAGALFQLDGTTEYSRIIDTAELGEDKVLLSFDLALPIQPQIDRANGLLTQRQLARDLPADLRESLFDENKLDRAIADLEKNPPRRKLRPHVEKFASYLRALDAREAGASNPDIAAVVFPKLSKEDGVQRVVNHYRAARRIRDKDYRLYAALADEGRS